TDTRLSMELCPDTDDVWLYWMASLGGAKIKRASQALQLIEWPNKNGDQLWKDNILQGKNDFNIKKMIDAYGAPWNDSVSKSKFSVAEYWDDRYKAGGNSGAGSYGRLAEFKAHVINLFFEQKGIFEVIEFGCGDGNQLSLFAAVDYLGIDVSPTAVSKCKARFSSDVKKNLWNCLNLRILKKLRNAHYLLM